ncbi:hypothetical protein RHS01_08525 [Rhizoctonia solani]|uniref:Vegetative incompatibility protein HET-E-1 [Podospora anserina] n=1 Tax=Rhizoctonia solani TaxID=456999 RepID=A0A8H7I7I7_9AGAM|nr:hypothetical protein RHS01_08525 [Rhizoctonia solani]
MIHRSYLAHKTRPYACGIPVIALRRPAKPSEVTSDIFCRFAASPHSSRVASGSSDGTVCVWDLRTGKLVLGPLKGHDDYVWSVVYTPDGTCIVSCSDDRIIRIWDAQTGSTVNKPLTGHTDGIRAVTVSPDSRLIASGSRDHSVRLWDLQSGILVGKPLDRHTSWVQSVDFSPDGLHVISGPVTGMYARGTLRMVPSYGRASSVLEWLLVSGSYQTVKGSILLGWRNAPAAGCEHGVAVSDPWEGHSSDVWDVSISPDGTMAASASEDRTIGLWNVQTGTLLAPLLQGHTGRVLSVAFSRDGKHVISGSDDGTVRVWDIETAVKTKDEAARKLGGEGRWMGDGGRVGGCTVATTRPGDPFPYPPLFESHTRPRSVQADFDQVVNNHQWVRCL